MEYQKKVAIVTGSGMGIGRATAMRLAQKGAKVIVSDIDKVLGPETCKQILSDGGEAVFIPCDVSRAEQVQLLFQKALATFGRLDILVNNAGVGSFLHKGTADVSISEYSRVIAVNQNGVFYCTQEGIRAMLQHDAGGRIVNVSSLAGITGVPNASIYAMSKHAVIGLTRSAAIEYAKNRIRINAVCPGITKTKMGNDYLDQLGEKVVERIKKGIPMRRLAEIEEVVDLIDWLCSDQSRYITGEAIRIDGGFKA